MSRETWLIEPHDSLIVRDGRPFGTNSGSRAKSLDFPFPSTLIGSVRTRVGLVNGGDWSGFSDELIEQIQQIEMRGAILTEIKDDETLGFFSPAPADALYVKPENDGDNNLFPLMPLEKGYISNLQDGLHLLGIREEVKGKPVSEVKFWNWERFAEWLIEAETDKVTNEHLGIGGLVSDQRTHVKIDYERKSNIEGGLFQTRGLEFTSKGDRKRLALTLEIEYKNEFAKKLKKGLFPLGGERRIVRWENKEGFDFETRFAELKEKVKSRIEQSKDKCHCRLILLTPGYFENGFLPTNLNVEVKAVAVNRSQVISGWDFKGKFDEQKNKFVPCPKPTRRLTPAGAVYFLKITGDIEKFVEDVWFKNVGDCGQLRRDGFGLAVLGNWDGKYHTI